MKKTFILSSFPAVYQDKIFLRRFSAVIKKPPG